jgi:hypothetical protein
MRTGHQSQSANSGEMPVMVHGATLADALRAVIVTGMRQVTTFPRSVASALLVLRGGVVCQVFQRR